MRYTAATHVGKVRQKNEDCFKTIIDLEGIPDTFIIADGMGGHQSGEIASKLAVETAYNFLIENCNGLDNVNSAFEIIDKAINTTNLVVYNKSSEKEEYSGMGTTLIIAMLIKGKLIAGHIGDSRMYVVREGQLRKLTTDHSYIEELIKMGSITPEEAENHPGKNIITRAVGCFEKVQTEYYSFDVKENDVFFLCTDGLTNMVSEEKINSIILNSNYNIEQACTNLIDEANNNGGRDNITIIIFKP